MGDGETAAGQALLVRNFNLLPWKSGLYRPTMLVPTQLEGNPPTIRTSKACLPDHNLCGSQSLQNFLLELLLPELGPYSMAGHKGILSIHGLLDLEGLSVPMLIVCDPTKLKVIKLIPDYRKSEALSLMHVRTDDSGKYYNLVLVTGSRRHLSNDTEHYVDEYDSRTDTWERVENANLPDNSFQAEPFQNGAYYKGSNEELLFCISTRVDTIGSRSLGVLKCDLKSKRWVSCQMPEVEVTVGEFNVVQPMGIEECGGLIFLFSELRCGQDVAVVFIHKLTLDDAGNVTWEQFARKQRSCVSGVGFFVYPDSTCDVPSSDEISASGGCVFAFSVQKCGGMLRIYEWNLDGSGSYKWGPSVIREFEIPKPVRAPNWTDDEKQGLLLLMLEALKHSSLLMLEALKHSSLEPPWHYISKGLWEWGAIDKRSKMCQEQWDSLLKAYKVMNKNSNTNGFEDINFEQGLNRECHGLITEILAEKVKIKSGRSRKKIKPNSTHPSAASGPSSTMAPPLASSIQPSAADGPSSSTAQLPSSTIGPASTADGPSSSTAQLPSSTIGPASTADGPSSSTAQLPSSTIGPTSTADGPSSSTAQLPSSTIKGPASSANGPFLSLTVSPHLASTISVEYITDFQRAMNVLQEMTDTQKRELYKKTVEVANLRAKIKLNATVSTDDQPFSNFNDAINTLPTLYASNYKGHECFDLLYTAIETDYYELAHKDKLSKQLPEEQLSKSKD